MVMRKGEKKKVKRRTRSPKNNNGRSNKKEDIIKEVTKNMILDRIE